MFATRSRAAAARKPSPPGWLVGAALLAGAMMLGSAAQAAPLAAARSAAQAFESDVLQVRDGCGPGMRFSYRRDRCVPIDREVYRDGRYDDDRRYRRRDGGDGAAAAAVATGVVLGVMGATAIRSSNRRNSGGTVNQGRSGGTRFINGGSGNRNRN